MLVDTKCRLLTLELYVKLPFGTLVLLISMCLAPLALMPDLSRLAVVSGVALLVLAFGLLTVAMSGAAPFGVPPLPQRLLICLISQA